MKQRISLLFILCMVFLSACGNRSEPETVTTISPWPSHAPEATPYVRLQSEASGMPSSETEQGQAGHYESYEDIIRSIPDKGTVLSSGMKKGIVCFNPFHLDRISL